MLSAPARMPARFWLTAAVVALAATFAITHQTLVLPYLWPAGHGIVVAGDPAFLGGPGDRALLYGRVPDLTTTVAAVTRIRDVVPDSPAAAQGLKPGDVLASFTSPRMGRPVDLSRLATLAPDEQLRVWRDVYHAGPRGAVEVRVGEGGTVTTVLERPAMWSSAPDVRDAWWRQHGGIVAQTVVFVTCAVILLLLRGDDPSCALAILAFAVSGVANAGPLYGAERVFPPLLREIVTLFSWTALPLAFPLAGMAAAYFPRRSPLIERYRWLPLVPYLVVLPLLVTTAATALYLSDVDIVAPIVLWAARTPRLFLATFSTAMAFNLAAIGEAAYRYRHLQDRNEQRRLRFAMVTAVVAFVGFGLKAGLPATVQLVTGRSLDAPWWVLLALEAAIILPAFGITYAIAVYRVLGPRLLLRRSLQYALARGTLTAIGVLPAIALVVVLVRQRDRTLASIVSGAPTLYAALVVLAALGVRYRERARRWLDERFFRREYDARRILVSLATRVRYETDPVELTGLVRHELEDALHPESLAVVVAGVDEDRLVPVGINDGAPRPLAASGGLAAMLRWSAEPLDVQLADPRSAFRRLPEEERDWLRETRAALLVPILGRESELVGAIVLGEKRSDEAYSNEDRQLLASIATQVGLGFDVARLRARPGVRVRQDAVATMALAREPRVATCPRCGRCDDESVPTCQDDGAALEIAFAVPRVVDRKYRLDRVLGRGGMGAVYRAHDVRLGRDVAIKVVRPDLLDDADARARFRREAQIVARLSHPAIVSIFDYGTLDAGGAFLVMEFVRGEDLRRVLRREGRLPLDRVLRLLTPVCDAVDLAHREGVVHRDIKPENLLVMPTEPGVKLLDFGIAKLVAQDIDALETHATVATRRGTLLGTPAYMAPEQLRGGTPDARSDVFSLGVLCYELLSGELPFGVASVAEIASRHVTGATRLDAREGIPPTVALAVDAALQVDPERRPASANRLAEMLVSGG